jgi:hypothetical protein
VNPSATKAFGVQIEFRSVTASLPPFERATMARELPDSGCVQLSSQSLSSSVARRSMSSSVSQPGSALRKSAKRRAPPDAARIFGILPEIVDQPAVARDIGNVVASVVDRRERIAIGLELPAAESFAASAGFAGRRSERAFAFDFLEPEIGIIVGRGDGRPVVDCHGLNSRNAGRLYLKRA